LSALARDNYAARTPRNKQREILEFLNSLILFPPMILLRIWIRETGTIRIFRNMGQGSTLGVLFNNRTNQSRDHSGFLRNFFALFKKLKRCRVQAITLAGWRRTVGEDMSLMAVAPRTADLDATHAVAAIFDVS
jgi:hypothetical protein